MTPIVVVLLGLWLIIGIISVVRFRWMLEGLQTWQVIIGAVLSIVFWPIFLILTAVAVGAEQMDESAEDF